MAVKALGKQFTLAEQGTKIDDVSETKPEEAIPASNVA